MFGTLLNTAGVDYYSSSLSPAFVYEGNEIDMDELLSTLPSNIHD